MVEDCLVECQVIPDDDQKYVGMISMTAEKVGKDGQDEVEVCIKSLKQEPRVRFIG